MEDWKMADVSQLLSDWGKAVASMDVTKGTEGLLKVLSGLQVPGVNMDALVATQRDNLEALSTSNRAALEGMKAIGEWQVKILHATLQQLTAAIEGLARSGSPQELIAAETELARKAFETAVGEMRGLAEIVIRANQQATDAIVKRIPESLEEIKDVLKLP
jgi:phasin family protein